MKSTFPSPFGLRGAATLAALCFLVSPAFSSAGQPALAGVLQPYVEKRALAGAVALVASSNRTLAIATAGWAEVAKKRPMREDTVFWIASQTKGMTAAAVMMLVDEGKIGLDDPVQKYLPEFNDLWVAAESDPQHMLLKRPARPVTIRMLLSHTSGMPFKSRAEEPTLDALPLRDAVRSYAMTPLLSEPGTKYLYSNTGINTAARVLEIVSGMSYEDFMQKRLFDPLGMDDTTFWPSERQVRRLATSYRPNAAKDGLEAFPISQLTYPLSDRTRRYPMPAGGLFSTAADVASFCQMLFNRGVFKGRRLLSEEAVRAMTTKQTGDQVQNSYGLGLSCGEGWAGHGGAHATDMSIDWKLGLITVWMVQHAGYPFDGGKAKDDFKKAAAALAGAAAVLP